MFRMDLSSCSIVFAEKLMHIFSKTNDDNECRTESAQQKHRDQNVIDELQNKVHSKSVLLSTAKAQNLIDKKLCLFDRMVDCTRCALDRS